MARVRIEGRNLTMALFRTRDRLTPVAEDRFLATYDNDDADEVGERTLEFQRDGGAVTGFLMQADPIRDIGFRKIPND